MLRHLDRTAFVGVLALAAGLAACDRAPTAPGAADVAASTTSSQTSDAAPLAAEGVTYAATGAGQQWSIPPGEEMKPALRRFTFTAQEKADGTVAGHYNIVAASGLHIEGVVTCLTVVDGRAWIGGTFRNAQPAPTTFTPVGVVFEVLDGGRGPDAIDQISNLGIFAAELGATEENVQDFCDAAIPGPISPIDLGSVMVE